MQKLFPLLFIIIFIFSCNQTPKKVDKENALGDTIQTASGLKYYYLKRGNGRKIEESSKVSVYTDLFLNNSDSVFWTTATAADSLFTFYHKKTSLIKGFRELHDYLVEGDEVIAYIPDSIAYGKEGSRGIPPKTTLVYNPLIVKSVSEPKALLSDSLYTITKDKGVQSATAFYDQVMSSEQKNAYHADMDLMINNFLRSLSSDNLFLEVEAFAKFFMSKTNVSDHQRTLAFQASSAAEAQKKYKEAITYLEPWAEKEPDQPWWKNKIAELNKKLEDN
jgi:hypothetical protein